MPTIVNTNGLWFGSLVAIESGHMNVPMPTVAMILNVDMPPATTGEGGAIDRLAAQLVPAGTLTTAVRFAVPSSWIA